VARPPKTQLSPDHKKLAGADIERRLSGKKRLSDEQIRVRLQHEGFDVTQQMINKIRNDKHYFVEHLVVSLNQLDEIRERQIALLVEALNMLQSGKD
jgi:hypothetical protein